MITSQAIAKELKKRGNKTVKMIFLNPKPALNVSVILRDGKGYNYPEEGKLTSRITVKEVCDYIQKKEFVKIYKDKVSKLKKKSLLKKVVKKFRKAIK